MLAMCCDSALRITPAGLISAAAGCCCCCVCSGVLVVWEIYINSPFFERKYPTLSVDEALQGVKITTSSDASPSQSAVDGEPSGDAAQR